MIARHEFLRIRDRLLRAQHAFGQRACLRVEAAGAAVGPWPACRQAMERAARREQARLEATRDQYEAAVRDVPAWWNPADEDEDQA